MSMFSDKGDKPYHAPNKGEDWALQHCTDEQLETWSNDSRCIEREKCAAFLGRRKARQVKVEAARVEHLAKKRELLLENPFDPRTEISADAKHIARKIVMHLWILFVLLPIVAAILFAILK